MASETITSPTADVSVGSIISRSFSIMFQKPVIFLGLAVISMVLISILEVLTVNFDTTRTSAIPQNILNLMLQGAASYAVFQILRGEKNVTFWQALSKGTERLGALFAVSLGSGILIGLGTLFFIVPGLILSCMWAVIIPACVVERLGAADSMTRSSNLTKGYRMKIFGLIVFSFVFAMIAVVVATYLGIWAFAENPIADILLTNILLVIPQAFNYVMVAIIYYELRAVKEGITIDALASVFD